MREHQWPRVRLVFQSRVARTTPQVGGIVPSGG